MQTHRSSRHIPAQPNQSIERGLICLLELASSDRPRSCADLSRSLGYDRTRISRTLGTLAHLGLAERLPDRRYRSGPGLHVLSALSLRTSALLRTALPHLRTIKETHGYDSALGVLWQARVCYLYHSYGKTAVEESIGGHQVYPADRSSIGRVLLAQRDEAEIGELYERYSGSLSTPRGRLSRELEACRRRGYATNPGSSLAVPIGTPAYAGLSVVGALSRREEAPLASMLREVGDRISEEMRR